MKKGKIFLAKLAVILGLFLSVLFGNFTITANSFRADQLISVQNQQYLESSLPETKFEISFSGKIAEASTRKINLHRTLERVYNRAVDRTEYKLRKNLNDKLDNVINLLDPKSSDYKKWSANQTLSSLPYGKTRVFITGSKASYLRQAINKSTTAAIISNLYKVGPNGRRGPALGFTVLKVYDPEDLIYED